MAPRTEICPDLQRFSSADCCDICRDQHDELVYCAGCDVAVHSWCYGGRLGPGIPDDDWVCDRCQYDGAGTSSCALCPRLSGAMKLTTDHRWAHIQCALWVPEAFFRYPSRSDILDLLQIPAYRFELECIFCRTVQGACFTCSDSTCRSAFHIPCAMMNGVEFDYKQSKASKGTGLVYAYCCLLRTGAERSLGAPGI